MGRHHQVSLVTFFLLILEDGTKFIFSISLIKRKKLYAPFESTFKIAKNIFNENIFKTNLF